MNDKLYIKKFIRDDGEKLSFDGEQLYLAQENTLLVRPDPSTTAVNFTEADGGEMIHQQNTTYDQPVNGLIIPKSTDYWTLTKQLSLFFKVNHTYKIVYIKKDGSMFAASNAWISSGLQIVPMSHEEYSRWSITMTIGNVNWTEYAEDSQGNEIYSNTITLPLLSSATGGEEWEHEEQDPVSKEGSQITFDNTAADAEITDLTVKGDTFQQTYSGKNMFNLPNGPFTSASVDWVVTDGVAVGSGTISGSSSNTSAFNDLPSVLPAGTYTVSIGEAINYKTRFLLKDSNGTDHNYDLAVGATSRTFTTEHNVAKVRVGITGATAGTELSITILHPQLEAGDEATDYEPYTGGPAPNPSFPQDINVVTGVQTVTVGNGMNSNNYTIDLGSTELCKISDYQDYIYKNENDWYIHKEIKKATLDGTESWTLSGTGNFFVTSTLTDIIMVPVNSDAPIKCDYYKATSRTNVATPSVDFGIAVNYDTPRLYIRNKDISTAAAFQTWLGTHNTTVYYALATSTDTQITDNTLIGELEALYAAQCYDSKTIITVSATGTNLSAILAVTLLNPPVTGEVWDNVGTVWELGSGGPQTINIDSTTTVYPVWVVQGPCINPTLQNNTTDTLAQYDGTIAAGQTLTVDFAEGTAHLDSALVTRYVSGLVSLRPGDNTLGFNSDGGATETSTISWNNVIN